MRLRNTSGIDNDLARKIINFVLPSGLSKFDVMLKMCSGLYGGMAYYKGSGYHMSADPFVTVRIGPSKLFPYNETKKQPGYIPVGWIYNRTEAMVLVLAHELRHLWQDKVKKGHRVWGARGQFSERDADAYAIGKLRQWRREYGVTKEGC